jgi:hypothetical protein
MTDLPADQAPLDDPGAAPRPAVLPANDPAAPPLAALPERDADAAPPPDTLAEIATAAADLLVPSENDAPLEAFRWPGPGPLTQEALLEHLGLPPATAVVTGDLASFFDPLARRRDWYDEAQLAAAERFAALRDLIAARLSAVMVYRLGTVEITVIIAGQDPAGTTVGLRTTLIET